MTFKPLLISFQKPDCPFPSQPSSCGSSLSSPSSKTNAWRCTLCCRLSFTRDLCRNDNISSCLEIFCLKQSPMISAWSNLDVASEITCENWKLTGEVWQSLVQQFCSHTSLLDRGDHNHRVRSGMHMPVALSCKSSWTMPGKIRANPSMPILNLRFEAELSHKCWLRGNNHRCKAERAINLCETELLFLSSLSNPVVQKYFFFQFWVF